MKEGLELTSFTPRFWSKQLLMLVQYDEDDEEIHRHFKTVVGAVLLVVNPLSVRTLSELLRVSNISTTLAFSPFSPPHPRWPRRPHSCLPQVIP
jgi:hypothetical protein